MPTKNTPLPGIAYRTQPCSYFLRVIAVYGIAHFFVYASMYLMQPIHEIYLWNIISTITPHVWTRILVYPPPPNDDMRNPAITVGDLDDIEREAA